MSLFQDSTYLSNDLMLGAVVIIQFRLRPWMPGKRTLFFFSFLSSHSASCGLMQLCSITVYMSFWSCFGLLTWLVTPHAVSLHLIFYGISGDEIAF